jgi:folate-binding protein YgfZ
MTILKTALLPARGVIAVSGDDRVSFLQGLVSNDVSLAAPGRAVWAALLTPQGKWLSDFFVFSNGTQLLLDVERAHAGMLVQRLTKFRLRAKVSLADLSDTMHVYAAWDGVPEQADGLISAPDPRLDAAGWRLLASTALLANADAADWNRHRLALGLPDGSADLEAEKSILLEAGFDELAGVSWTKGCYMGQELTARTKYRGLVKRRLVPVEIDGPLPLAGTPVMADGQEVGTMRSAAEAGQAGLGLASIRIDAWDTAKLTCADATLRVRLPAWIAQPA